MKEGRLSELLLLVLGVLTLGTGAFFLFLRPAMLPEDVRVTGLAPEAMPPAVLSWLRIVFRTLGGFVAGFGILLVSIASHKMTSRPGVLAWGVAFAVLVAFGRFLASNVTLRSDYLWFVELLFGIAVLTALCIVRKA